MTTYIYPNLLLAQKRAKKLDLPKPQSSQRLGKKLSVVYNGKTIHFGARDYSDYLEHEDKDRRERYRARARGILLANGTPAYLDKNQPAYYAYKILW
jgi:hypothetical protein